MDEIFSSAGGPGTSRRQDNRLYHNAEIYHDSGSQVADVYEDLKCQATAMSDISRVVFRGVVSHGVLVELHHSELSDQIEVALPLNQYGEESWLTYLASNNSDRIAANSFDEIVRATAMPPTTPAEYARNGYVDRVRSSQGAQLHSLWADTFGWSENEIKSFVENVSQQTTLPSSERSLWFSGVEQPEIGLAAAAMAERIDMPSKLGSITLIESTEWRSVQRGLMPSVLRHLNQQIAPFRSSDGRPPVVYAETNFTSRSDRAGYKAGYRIPCRYYGRQVLEQHVTVNDGIRPSGLREFSFMALPIETLEAQR